MSIDQWKLQQAVTFLAQHTQEVTLSKPMMLHAIRVGEILWQTGAEETAIIAGYLHDLIEDTGCSKEMIATEFGEDIAQIVQANTMTEAMRGTEEGLKEFFVQVAGAGEEAVLVKAADLCDNLQNYRGYHAEERWKSERVSLERKQQLFLEQCTQYAHLPLYKVVEAYAFADHDAAYADSKDKL